jgi:hypothetical protein
MRERDTDRPVFNSSAIGWDGRVNGYDTSSLNVEGV